MTLRQRNILCLVLATAISLATASCHHKKDNIIYYKYDKKESTKGQKNTINDEWRTLQVKLDRHDNKDLYKELRSWLGTPYQYGGSTHNGTDCSGMVMVVYQNVYGIQLERNSAKIYENNCKDIHKKDLHEGDLVFFNNGKTSKITHVGIYLKEGKFVHASSSRGVVVSDLEQRYYVTHWQCAGRVKKK
ncbi:MAG: C40 family peptidase [Muribaculaceae bacterium]|nr:C40 family peptidase [Muribaculaceae bacterium]